MFKCNICNKNYAQSYLITCRECENNFICFYDFGLNNKLIHFRITKYDYLNDCAYEIKYINNQIIIQYFILEKNIHNNIYYTFPSYKLIIKTNDQNLSIIYNQINIEYIDKLIKQCDYMRSIS